MFVLFWAAGAALFWVLEALGINHHNVVAMNGFVRTALMPVVGLIAAVMCWLLYERRSREAHPGGRVYLLRAKSPSRWKLLGFAVAIFHGACAALMLQYLLRIYVHFHNENAARIEAEIIKVFPAGSRAISNCAEYAVLALDTGGSTQLCIRRRFGDGDAWKEPSPPHPGESVQIYGRSSGLGTVADQIRPLH